MTVTHKMHSAYQCVAGRFKYARDPKIDTWTINRGDGTIQGDCEDFSLSVLWELSDRSWFKFWMYLITFQAVIWFVKTRGGEGHAVIWFGGHWTDNTANGWYDSNQMTHKKIFPFIFPFVALKLIIGWVSRRFL